jgi:hypothetical protein
VPYWKLVEALVALSPSVVDGVIDYVHFAPTAAPGTTPTDAVFGVVDGGGPQGDLCALPPARPSSYTATCWRCDGIQHKSPNAHAYDAIILARAMAGVMGVDAGRAPILIPIDPSRPFLGTQAPYETGINLVLDGDDRFANTHGLNEVWLVGSERGYDAGRDIYTHISHCWGTGGQTIDAGDHQIAANDFAVPGQTCAAMAARRPATIDSLHDAKHTKVLAYECGRQDLIDRVPAATVCRRIEAYGAGAHAAGWAHVYTETMPYDPAIPSATVDALNACLRGVDWSALGVEPLIDVAADPQLGAALGTEVRAVFYSDGDGGLESSNGGTRHAAILCRDIQDAGFR